MLGPKYLRLVFLTDKYQSLPIVNWLICRIFDFGLGALCILNKVFPNAFKILAFLVSFNSKVLPSKKSI